MNYYNEIDRYCAEWLRNLIDAGHLPQGHVDERDIREVTADDVEGYAQCHWFAGLGGWPYALRLAGWPDDRPVWTGSCPCQPFSSAGQGSATYDERHLWPTWNELIGACRPPTVFGEQVEAAVGWGWLDLVYSDLEAQGYAVGAAVLPACSVGAPHIRQRLWFVGHAERDGSGRHAGAGLGAQARPPLRPERDGPRSSSAVGELVDAERRRCEQRDPPERVLPQPRPTIADGAVGHAIGARFQERGPARGSDGEAPIAPEGQAFVRAGAWDDLEWLRCTDGKQRPTRPGVFPLAHGIPDRVAKLRAAGNAIVPQVAAEFIKAATYVGEAA